MIRISMNEMTTLDWSFDEDIRQFTAARFDGIGIWRNKLIDHGLEEGVKAVLDSGLRVSSLSCAGGFTGANGLTYSDSLNDALSALHLACCLDAECLVIFTGPRRGHTLNHARRLTCNALSELVPVAEMLQVQLALKPMHPRFADDWSFLTDLEDAVSLVNSYESHYLKLALDTFHMDCSEFTFDRIKDIAGSLALVQLSDRIEADNGRLQRCRFGEGHVPIREIVTRLIDCGYEGSFDINLSGISANADQYPAILEESRQACMEMLGAYD